MKVFFTKKIEEGKDPNSKDSIVAFKVDKIDYCCDNMERICSDSGRYVDLLNSMYFNYDGIMFVKHRSDHDYPVIKLRSNTTNSRTMDSAEMFWCPFCGKKIEYELISTVVVRRVIHKQIRSIAEFVTVSDVVIP